MENIEELKVVDLKKKVERTRTSNKWIKERLSKKIANGK
jgi:hypothetical protein